MSAHQFASLRIPALWTLLLVQWIVPRTWAAPAVPSLTPEQRESRIQWWRDAKFGLFIHWGPSSSSGKEISWSSKGHPFDHPGNETIPSEVYDNLYRQFNPVKFNADQWMQMAKDAGMKYVVFVTKHHDGFSMWPTQLRSEYSIAATPFQRDICGEIAGAARKHGLKLGWYYSTRNWTHPDYLRDGNRKYDDFYRGQIRELLSNYGPVDILWFDHVSGNWADYRYDELFHTIYELQPNILVNNRAAAFIRTPNDRSTPEIATLVQGDFDTPEQRIGTFQRDRAWESCVTLTHCADGGGWWYRPDGRTLTFRECVQMLASCTTGDGNLLLNVGPLPSGEIDPDQVQVIQQMGRWLAKSGESISRTARRTVSQRRVGRRHPSRRHTLATCFKWPGNTLRLEPLKRTIQSARVLTGGDAKAVQSEKGVEITLAKAQHNAVDTIIELTLTNP